MTPLTARRSNPTDGQQLTLDGLQTLVQLDLSSDVVGQSLGARPELDQRVRLLDAAADDAPRTVVLEAPAHKANAVRKQRRGERIALVPLVGSCR